MLAVILGFVLPIVLVPLVRAVTAIRFEIDQHHLDIRVALPEYVVCRDLGITRAYEMGSDLCNAGVAPLRVSLSLGFWGLRPLRVLRPPRDAEARLLTIWSVRPNGLRLRQPFWPAWA